MSSIPTYYSPQSRTLLKAATFYTNLSKFCTGTLGPSFKMLSTGSEFALKNGEEAFFISLQEKQLDFIEEASAQFESYEAAKSVASKIIQKLKLSGLVQANSTEQDGKQTLLFKLDSKEFPAECFVSILKKGDKFEVELSTFVMIGGQKLF